VRLLTENESHDGHATLPMARIVRSATGTFTLDPHYVPPILNFAASPYLMTMTGELLARLSARSSDLSELRRQRNQSLADFGTAGIATFWLLHTVNSHLPLIKHLLDTRRGHPAQLFEAMLGLAGSLTTFSTDILPQNLATYDHANLTSAFGSLGNDVFKLLETVLPSNCVTLPLTPHQEGNVRAFAVTVGDDHYLESDQLFLAVSADMRDADLLAAASGLKISSLEHVKELVQKSQPGLSLSFAISPPSEVRVKPKFKYFRLSQQGEAWGKIRKSRTFAVHGPSTFDSASFELVIVLPKT
jgi:type VI secretion system protein ImpJ